MTITFCGHSNTTDTPRLRSWLESTITMQILNGADQCLLGGYGNFDKIAASVVWKLKSEYPSIESILVLPYLDSAIEALKYDSTTYPSLENVPRRYAIIKRNLWMVDNADVIIANVRHGWGGAAKTLEYAVKKNKIIFNFSHWE